MGKITGFQNFVCSNWLRCRRFLKILIMIRFINSVLLTSCCCWRWLRSLWPCRIINEEVVVPPAVQNLNFEGGLFLYCCRGCTKHSQNNYLASNRTLFWLDISIKLFEAKLFFCECFCTSPPAIFRNHLQSSVSMLLGQWK